MAVTVFVAAVGIVGALTFAASEDELASDPGLWGWNFDAVLGDGNDPTIGERVGPLLDDPMIESLAGRLEMESLSLSAGDEEVETAATALEDLRGSIEPRMLEGIAPRSADEIALGGATARRLEVGVGDELTADGIDGPETLTVTGIVVMNLGFNADRIGEGSFLTPGGVERLGGDAAPVFLIVEYADGVDPDEAYAALHEDWGNTVLRPVRAIDVQQLHEVRHLPVWFSALLAAVAMTTLVLVLVLTIRRRRHELALLRALGFERRNVRTTVVVQALTLAVPAAVVGRGHGHGVGPGGVDAHCPRPRCARRARHPVARDGGRGRGHGGARVGRVGHPRPGGVQRPRGYRPPRRVAGAAPTGSSSIPPPGVRPVI